MPDPIASPEDDTDMGPRSTPERGPVDPATELATGPGSRMSWLTWLIVAVVLVAAAITALVATGSSGPSYRLASVTTGTVVQTLDSVGTTTPINQATLNFGTSGTVSTVSVTVGQAVTAGQTVAQLDPTPLQNAVTADQATLAGAQATLAANESGETSSVANNSTGAGSGSSSATDGSGLGTGASTASTASTAAAVTGAGGSTAGNGSVATATFDDAITSTPRATDDAYPGSGGSGYMHR